MVESMPLSYRAANTRQTDHICKCTVRIGRCDSAVSHPTRSLPTPGTLQLRSLHVECTCRRAMLAVYDERWSVSGLVLSLSVCLTVCLYGPLDVCVRVQATSLSQRGRGLSFSSWSNIDIFVHRPTRTHSKIYLDGRTIGWKVTWRSFSGDSSPIVEQSTDAATTVDIHISQVYRRLRRERSHGHTMILFW